MDDSVAASNSNASAIITMLVASAADQARGLATIGVRLDAVEKHKTKLDERIDKVEKTVEVGNADTKKVLEIVNTIKNVGKIVTWVVGTAIPVVAIILHYAR